MYKAIIFDADGMIVNSERFTYRLEKEHSISTKVTGTFFREIFPLCLVGKADLKEELNKCISSWGWQGNVDSLLNYWFLDTSNDINERFLSIISTLRSKGIKCYLATNNEKYRTNDLMIKRGLDSWFEKVYSSSAIGFKKPDFEFFDYIYNELKDLKKEEILFCDDDPENIEGAQKYGFSTHLFENEKSFHTLVTML